MANMKLIPNSPLSVINSPVSGGSARVDPRVALVGR